MYYAINCDKYVAAHKALLLPLELATPLLEGPLYSDANDNP